ncbi:MAG: phosphoribosyltransferase [Nitrospiraceae bacterium]|nr:phosphoribosyltransferase [Nitrospiraceae bacterium]
MFKDRTDSGRRLAARLIGYKGREDVLVLALPRGGVVTGYEIASILSVPLDIIIVRKIGFPGQPELAIGAIAETGAVILNKSIISTWNVPEGYIQNEISRQKEEISRRVKIYREGKSISKLEDRIVVLADDGVATGATMKAAISALKEARTRRLITAVPVSPPQTAEELKAVSDELICLETPLFFMAIGEYYEDFTQVSDEQVIELLHKSWAHQTNTA